MPSTDKQTKVIKIELDIKMDKYADSLKKVKELNVKHHKTEIELEEDKQKKLADQIEKHAREAFAAFKKKNEQALAEAKKHQEELQKLEQEKTEKAEKLDEKTPESDEKVRKEEENLAKKFAANEALKENLMAVAKTIQFVEEKLAQINTIIDDFSSNAAKSVNIGKGVSDVGDLTKSIGQALMGYKGDPTGTIPAVGAMLYLGGELTTLVGKLISTFVGVEKNASQIEQERAAGQRLIRDVLNDQLKIMELQKSMDEDSVDTAAKRLLILKQNLESEMQQLGIKQDISAVDAARAANEANEDVTRRQNLKQQAQDIQDGGRIARKSFLEAQGITVHWYDNTIQMVKDWIAANDVAIQQSQANAANYQDISDKLKKIYELTKASGEELTAMSKTSSAMLNVLGGDAESILTKLIEIADDAKATLTDALKIDPEITNESLATIIESYEKLDVASQEAAGLTPEKLKRMQEWLAAYQATIQQPIDEQRKEESLARAQLDEEHSTKQLTDIGYAQKLGALLTNQLTVEKQTLDNMIAMHAPNDKIIEQKERILSLETEIYNVMHDQSVLAQATAELNRKRNRLVMEEKAGKADNTQAILDLQNQIMEILKKGGATQQQLADQMATFNATLPSYAEGTVDHRTKEGVHYLHKGETVLNKEATESIDKMYPGFLDALNTSKSKSSDWLAGLLENYFASQMKLQSTQREQQMTGQPSVVNLGGINIHTQPGQNEQAISRHVQDMITRQFQGNGIQFTRL